jgi:myosin heavy subunit
VPLNPSREDQFYAILHSKSLKTGHLAVPTLTFADFCSALSLYCEMSQQKGARSKKTSFLHRKTALKLKNTVATLRGTQEQQEEALYQILIVLQQNKQVKAYGLDKVDSDLYLLFIRYRDYYFSTLVEKMTPWVLRRCLVEDFLEVKLTTEEESLLKTLKATLVPYAQERLENRNRNSIPSIAECYYLRLNKLKKENTLDNKDAKKLLEDQDAAFIKANEGIVDALKEGKVRNPQLTSIFTRYVHRYNKQLTQFSYTQAEENTQLSKQNSVLQTTLLTLESNHHAELALQKNAQLAVEKALEELTQSSEQQKKRQQAILHKQAVENNKLNEQQRELLKTNDALAQELRKKTEELSYTEKKLTTGNQSQQANTSTIEALEKAKEKTEADFVKSKQMLVSLTQELEKNQKQTEELNRRMQIARVDIIEQQTEIQQIKAENKTLKSSLATLMSVLRPLLEFFGLKRAGESAELKKKLGTTQTEQVDYLMLADLLKTECESHFKKEDVFPTKPPLETALSIFQQIIDADNNVREKLLKTHTAHIRHLVMKLIGTALESSKNQSGMDDLKAILTALHELKNKGGDMSIKMLSLPQGLVQVTHSSIEQNILENIKNTAIQNKLENLIDECAYIFGRGKETLGTARTHVRAPKVESFYGSEFFDSIKNRQLPPIPTTTKVEAAIDEVRTGLTP